MLTAIRVTVLTAAFVGLMVRGGSAAEKVYLVHLQVHEVARDGKTVVRGEPSVVVAPDQSGRFETGGVVPLGDKELLIGWEIDMRVKPAADGEVIATGMIGLSQLGSHSAGSVTVHSDATHFNVKIAPGKTYSLGREETKSGTRWVEIRVEHVEPLDPDSQASAR